MFSLNGFLFLDATYKVGEVCYSSGLNLNTAEDFLLHGLRYFKMGLKFGFTINVQSPCHFTILMFDEAPLYPVPPKPPTELLVHTPGHSLVVRDICLCETVLEVNKPEPPSCCSEHPLSPLMGANRLMWTVRRFPFGRFLILYQFIQETFTYGLSHAFWNYVE